MSRHSLLIAVALLLIGSAKAFGQDCRECDLTQIIPKCVLSETGASFCDDTVQGQCT